MAIKDVHYTQYLPQLLEQLPKGAFLTVRDGEKLNTMTIGWATIGFIWGKPIFNVLVRYSRHTYDLLEQAGEFTVSIPLNQDMKKELGICGSRSGRDMDKFSEVSLTPQPGQKISTPVVGECALHYECKVVFQQAMEPRLVDQGIQERFYPKHDYHIMYFGEILAAYLTD
jgi:flavin reductase (DIM6/NTAB) family NADH-FMN oxidoreductase RutF